MKILFSSLFQTYNLINNFEEGRHDLSSLMLFVIGGAVLSEEVYTCLRKVVPETCVVYNGYGLSEICGGATFFDFPEDVIYCFTKPRSVGRGFPGFSFKV